MTLAISGHGALVARAPFATPGVFTTIAEVGDIQAPGLLRNEFEALTQDKNIDAYIMGVLRRQPMTLSLNFLPSDGTHDHLTGLIYALIQEPPPNEGYKITGPPGSGMIWIFSGQVKEVQNVKFPVDGKAAADVTIRANGKMLIGATSIG